MRVEGTVVAEVRSVRRRSNIIIDCFASARAKQMAARRNNNNIIEIDSKPKRRHQRHNNRLQVDYQWSKARRAILTIIAEVSQRRAAININSGNKTMNAQFSTYKPALSL